MLVEFEFVFDFVFLKIFSPIFPLIRIESVPYNLANNLVPLSQASVLRPRPLVCNAAVLENNFKTSLFIFHVAHVQCQLATIPKNLETRTLNKENKSLISQPQQGTNEKKKIIKEIIVCLPRCHLLLFAVTHSPPLVGQDE